MIYFLWSLLNLGAAVWFLLIAFRVLKFVRENMGMLSTIIFVVGVFSFIKGTITNTNKKDDGAGQVIGMETLEHALFFNLDLSYASLKDDVKNNKLIGDVRMNGLVIGHHWNSAITSVDETGGNLKYEVTGYHQWQLLGIVLYDQPQEFKGTIKIK